MKNSNNMFIPNVGYREIIDQKQVLEKLIIRSPITEEDRKKLEGALNLLDYMQDHHQDLSDVALKTIVFALQQLQKGRVPDRHYREYFGPYENGQYLTYQEINDLCERLIEEIKYNG